MESTFWLLSINYELPWVIVACYVGQFDFPGKAFDRGHWTQDRGQLDGWPGWAGTVLQSADPEADAKPVAGCPVAGTQHHRSMYLGSRC